MPSKRDAISMTDDELLVYLRSQRRLILVSNGINTYPHPMPMNYMFDDEERFVMTTFRKSQKVKNLQRDPKVSLLVESGIAYDELKSVLAYAQAEIIDDNEEVLRTMMLLLTEETELSGNDLDLVKEQAKATAPKRVMLRFSAETYVSWDHTKLKGHY